MFIKQKMNLGQADLFYSLPFCPLLKQNLKIFPVYS